MSLMYWACLRVGEILVSKIDQHTIKMDSIFKVMSGNAIRYYIFRYKTFKCSPRGSKDVHITRHEGTTCPVTNLSSFLEIRTANSKYLFCSPSGKPYKQAWLVSKLRSLLKLLNLNTNSYCTHSFRVGACTDLVSQGASILQVKSLGRWRSFTFCHYIRPQVFIY